ncbi:MAG: hypothetical protein GY730_04070 [bacterium]|nr:hypothetical protein [bacterium]
MLSKNYLYCLLISILVLINSAVVYSETIFDEIDKPQTFTIDKIIKKNWGKLISVFNQPTSERLTFEGKDQITIVQIGLKWDPHQKCYVPSIKQIIKLVKDNSASEKISTPSQKIES